MKQEAFAVRTLLLKTLLSLLEKGTENGRIYDIKEFL